VSLSCHKSEQTTNSALLIVIIRTVVINVAGCDAPLSCRRLAIPFSFRFLLRGVQ